MITRHVASVLLLTQLVAAAASTGCQRNQAPSAILPAGEDPAPGPLLLPDLSEASDTVRQPVVRESFDTFTLPDGDGTWLIVTTVVEDPQFLTQDFVISSQFKKESDLSQVEPSSMRHSRTARRSSWPLTAG